MKTSFVSFLTGLGDPTTPLEYAFLVALATLAVCALPQLFIQVCVVLRVWGLA